MTEFTVKLIMILVPGLIGALIVEHLTIHKTWNQFRIVIYALVISLTSYALLQVAMYVWHGFSFSINWEEPESGLLLNTWSDIDNGEVRIDIVEILLAIFFAVLIALTATAVSQHKLMFRFARKIGISYKYGDESLLSYYLASPEVVWVTIRDLNRKLIFQGVVDSLSEEKEIREIGLREVSVYDYESAQFLYDADAIYLSFPYDGIQMEIER